MKPGSGWEEPGTSIIAEMCLFPQIAESYRGSNF